MTQLLVSVRDRAEAIAAFDGGADLLDVKEPDAGSLGQASVDVIQRCSDLASEASVPCSAALGELCESERSAAERLAGTTGLAFAKVGLAGAALDRGWASKLESFWRGAPSTVTPVAVAYADWQRAHAPRLEEVLESAKGFSCGALLVDTYHKDGGNLLEILGEALIRDLVESSHRVELRIVLAGSLRRSDMAVVSEMGADIIAVRGAVCRGPRTSRVEARLVRQIKNELTLSRC